LVRFSLQPLDVCQSIAPTHPDYRMIGQFFREGGSAPVLRGAIASSLYKDGILGIGYRITPDFEARQR
jgi:hypothetical protein